MVRKIVEINQDKCNGCGLCAKVCHEGAIEMRGGKAHLKSDEYCDGLGDCLTKCPVGAINIIERDADQYDEEAANKNKTQDHKDDLLKCGCPGSREHVIRKENVTSELKQWPVQINLINPNAGYLNGSDLLIAADCAAYAYGSFHRDFMKNHLTLIGCPKHYDSELYEEKLAQILKYNDIATITVVRMEVPCCGGIVDAVRKAMISARTKASFNLVTISTDGRVL